MNTPCIDAWPPSPPASRALDDWTALPLFHFGGAGGPPIAVIAGGLILDLGEAERTFVYRCQDRFLAYSSLWGLRSIFFVASDAHATLYRAQIASQRERFERIGRRTGLFATTPLLEPVYVGCDIDTMQPFACAGFAAQWQDAGPLGGIALNQVSPTYAALMRGVAALLRPLGMDVDWPLDDLARMAGLAMRCADKADYLALALGQSELPAHVPTAPITAAELSALSDYNSLAALYRTRSGADERLPKRLFVKSTLNSAGNLAALVDVDSLCREIKRLAETLAREAQATGPLAQQTAELRREVDEAPCLRPLDLSDEALRGYKREQAKRRQRVDFLVQREVRRNGDDSAFSGIGLSYVIGADGSIAPLGATAQIYRDRDRKHFLGAFLSAEVARGLAPAFESEMHALCRLYAARGYRGPINFDARRNDRRQYELIYDCNPRLTGIFPSLAVRDALVRSNLPVRSVLSLGYRGEFVLPDLDAALARLDDAGLLCTRARPGGALLMPNLCRENGFDLHLVNVDLDEANRLLAGPLGALSAGGAHPQCLYG